jgi:hypothetical protein
MWGRSKNAEAGVRQQQQQQQQQPAHQQQHKNKQKQLGDSTSSLSGAKTAEWAIRPLSLFGLTPGSRKEDEGNGTSKSACNQTGSTPDDGNQETGSGSSGKTASPAVAERKLTPLGKMAADPISAMATPGKLASKGKGGGGGGGGTAGLSRSSPLLSTPVPYSSALSGDAMMVKAAAEPAGSTPGKEDATTHKHAASTIGAAPLSAHGLGVSSSSSPLSSAGAGSKADESSFLTARVVNGKISKDDGGRTNHVFVLHCTFGRTEWCVWHTSLTSKHHLPLPSLPPLLLPPLPPPLLLLCLYTHSHTCTSRQRNSTAALAAAAAAEAATPAPSVTLTLQHLLPP